MIYKMQYPLWTDYNPSCSLNRFLQKTYHTTDSNEYRYFLQHNADKLRDNFLKCAEHAGHYTQCSPDVSISTWKPRGYKNK
jgi:hypothetical protein